MIEVLASDDPSVSDGEGCYNLELEVSEYVYTFFLLSELGVNRFQQAFFLVLPFEVIFFFIKKKIAPYVCITFNLFYGSFGLTKL